MQIKELKKQQQKLKNNIRTKRVNNRTLLSNNSSNSTRISLTGPHKIISSQILQSEFLPGTNLSDTKSNKTGIPYKCYICDMTFQKQDTSILSLNQDISLKKPSYLTKS
jgi:hypothetical protein